MDLKDLRSKENLIPPHPLRNIEMQKHYQTEPRFNGVYSRDNLPKKINGGAYVINPDEYGDVGTHRIANKYSILKLFITPKEIKNFIGNNNIKTNIFRIQANNSIIYEYFFNGFIDFILAGKTLIDNTSLLSPYNLKKYDNIIFSCF